MLPAGRSEGVDNVLCNRLVIIDIQGSAENGQQHHKKYDHADHCQFVSFVPLPNQLVATLFTHFKHALTRCWIHRSIICIHRLTSILIHT